MNTTLHTVSKYHIRLLTVFLTTFLFFLTQPSFSQTKKIVRPIPADRTIVKHRQEQKLSNINLKNNSTTKTTKNKLASTTYYVNDNSIAGDHYTLAIGNDLLGNGSALLPFATIQHAVDVAAPGDIIYVDAGIYAENIIISTNGLDIRGSNYNHDPNTAPRPQDESIIVPATSDPDYTNSYSVVVSLNGNLSGTSIDGFTIDGDNPDLTSDSTVNGADVDANDAISAFGDASDFNISNNIIQNFNYTGIDIYTSGTVGLDGNTFTANKIDNVDGIYGIGILIYNDFYADITSNVLTRVHVGIQTGNFYIAKPGGGSDAISNNSVKSFALGIWHNLAYQNASVFSITNNTLTSENNNADYNEGIEISSIQQTVAVNVSGNNVTGTHVGIDLWNNPTSATVTINGGTISGCNIGLFPNNYDGYNSDAASSSYAISNVTIANCDTSIWVRDNGLNSNNATVALAISNSTNINGGSLGLLIEGADASVAFNGATPASFSGQQVYISQITNGTDVPSAAINATNVSFNGNTGANMSLANLFATEDKIVHKMDNAALGFVTVKALNDYVTSNSGSVQRGIDNASNGWTVNVASGTFNEALLVNKSVTIKGAQAGVLAKGRSGAESIIDPNSSAAHGFNVVTDNVTIDGFTITNSAAYPSPSTERYGVVTINKVGSGNFTGITIKNNIISRQYKAIDFNYTDNFEISNNWLHGENDDYNYGCMWIASYGQSSSSGLVTNNDLDGYSSAVEIQGNGTQPVTGLTISANRSTGSQYVFFGLQNSTVYRNSVLNVTTGSHVFVGGGCSNDMFTENFFDNGTFNGISISNGFGAGVNSTLTFNSNSITGHNASGKYEVLIAPSSYTGTLDATCNWFGTANGTTIAGKVSGAVNFTPWLISGTDNSVTTPGFQPVPGSCTGSLVKVAFDSVKNIKCYGSSTGGAYISVTGGSAPYTYSWSNGTTNQDLTNVPAGTYKVVVTDNYGQKDSLTHTVSETSTQLVASSNAGTIACNGGTTTVTVSASGGLAPYSGTGTFTVAAGSYSFTVTDANGCTAITTGNVTQPSVIVVSATPGTIQCPGGTTTVAVSATGGTPPYTGVGTFTANAGSHTYTVTDSHGCSKSKTINIADGTGTPPHKPGTISGTQYNLCQSGSHQYSVAAVTGATSYTWTAPAGFTIQGNGTRTVTITVPSSFTTSGQIKVTASNSCGTSAASVLTVYAVTPNPASRITGPTSVTKNQSNVVYSLPVLTNVTYTWSVPQGASITSGQGTNKIKVSFGANAKSGNVSVFISNACGSSPTGRLAVTVSGSVKDAAQEDLIATTDIIAFPNPTGGVTNISFNTGKTGKYTLYVADINGKQILQTSGITITGNNLVKIDLSSFANGVYIAKLLTEDYTKTLKLIKEK